jgi:ribosomal-protein-alanine N-acetyltransferase
MLRSARSQDRDLIVALSLDGQVRRYLGGPVSKSEAEQRASNIIAGTDTKHCWVVKRIDEAQDHGVGVVHISAHHDGFDDELSFEFLPHVWGLGLATEAVKAAMAHAFTDLEYTRLVSETQDANVSSRRLLERIGMTLEKEVMRFGQTQVIYALTSCKMQ